MIASSNRKLCEVCYIKSPFNFWVRLEENKDEYNNMMKQLQKEYDRSNEVQDASQCLTVGSIYCTFNQRLFEWHRCEILSINNNDIAVKYIDIGNVDLVSSKSVKLLKEYYKSMKRFSIHCSLINIKPNSENGKWSINSIAIFTKLVLNHVMTIDFKSKKDNIFYVDLEIKKQNIGNELLREGVACKDLDISQLNQEPSSPLVLKGQQKFVKAAEIIIDPKQKLLIEVTHIYSPFCFYAQLSDNLESFLEFESQMQKFYENELKQSDILLLKNPKIGQMCIAKYSDDQNWYRAIIKSVDNDLNSVSVFFVDYGNEDTVSIDNSLLMINDQFKSFPRNAIKLCLNGIKPIDSFLNRNQEIVDFMFSEMTEKCLASFVGKLNQDCYLVEITVDKMVEEGNKKKLKTYDLADLLVRNNFVIVSDGLSDKQHEQMLANNKRLTQNKVQKPSQDLQKTIKEYKSSELLLKDKKYEMSITHIETVYEFYVQNSSDAKVKEFRQMTSDLQYFYERKLNLPQPLIEEKNACTYFDDEKKKWYRAQIIKLIDKDHSLIRLVDYGFTRYVNNALLKEIYDKFLDYPCQAILAALDDMYNHRYEVTDEQLHSRFKSLALNKKLYGRVMDLVPDENSILNQEHSKKYLLNLFDIESGMESIYKMLAENLNESVMDVNDKFKPRIISKLEETSANLCVDSTIMSETIGNTTVIENSVLKAKTNGFINKDSLKDDSSPFPRHEENFKSTILDQVDNKVIHQIRPLLNTNQVKTILSTNNEKCTTSETFTPELKIKTNYHYYDSIMFNFDSNKPYSIMISHYDDTHNFYAQINDLFADFDSHFVEFNDYCSTVAQNLSFTELKKMKNTELMSRLALGAKFYDDNQWYRARICYENTAVRDILYSEKDEQEIMIEFIDYGNRQITKFSDIVCLNEKFSKFCPAAIKCNGTSYLDILTKSSNSKISNQLVRFLLYNGCLNKTAEELNVINDDKFVWKHAYFYRINSQTMVEIDEFYSLFYKSNLIRLDLYLNPAYKHEFIQEQYDEKEINLKLVNQMNPADLKSKPQPAALTIDANLNYMDSLSCFYFISVEAQNKLKHLEAELANEKERINSLVKLELNDIKKYQFYLINLNNRFYRSFCSNNHEFLLIDYGNKIKANKLSHIYILPTRYYKFKILSFQCRLTNAINLERAMSNQEKESFFKSIKLNKSYKIKILSLFEPYVFEFLNESASFSFVDIIRRAEKNIEPQLITYKTYLQNEFDLITNWKNKNEINLFTEPKQILENRTKDIHIEKIYLKSKLLFEQFKKFNSILTKYYDYLIQIGQESQPVKLVEKDFYLARPTTKSFVTSITDPDTRKLIETSWSRVMITKIKKIQNDKCLIKLIYCDYGIESEFECDQGSNNDLSFRSYVDIKLIDLNHIQFKIMPCFVYECFINQLDLGIKLSHANRRNEFIDFDYMNKKLVLLSDEIASLKYKVNFDSQLDLNTMAYQIDLIEKEKNQNFIDKIIEFGIQDIQNYTFEAIITHFNNIYDFFVQKEDAKNQQLILDLQELINNKVRDNKLKKFNQKINLNQLCIAFFDEDQQYYRAQVVKIISNSMVEVFYIDYGNKSIVNVDNLRELESDLINNLPKSLAINCEAKISQDLLLSQELEELNKFIMESLNDMRFEIKFLRRKMSSFYYDRACYEVELYDAETKENIYKSFIRSRQAKPIIQNVDISCQQFSKSTTSNITSSSDEDNAIAESTGGASLSNTAHKINDTQMDNTTNLNFDQFSASVSQLPINNTVMSNKNKSYHNKTNHDDDDWETTAQHLKNFDYYQNTLNETNFNQNNTSNISSQIIDITANEASSKTDPNDSNKTLVQSDSINENDSIKENDLYETVNEESSITFNNDYNNEVILENCLIGFMDSPNSLYIHEADFEEKYKKMVPLIDSCLDPFDLNESKLCIGKFIDDGMYYRCKVISWDDNNTLKYLHFIDFGNKDWVHVDEITRMSDELSKIPPMAIYSTLDFNIEQNSVGYKQLENLANNETKFNVVFKKDELAKFRESKFDYENPCVIKLFASSCTNLIITKTNLENESLWTSFDNDQFEKMEQTSELKDLILSIQVDNIKQEPLTPSFDKLSKKLPNKKQSCSDDLDKSTINKKGYESDDEDNNDRYKNSLLTRSHLIATSTQNNLIQKIDKTDQEQINYKNAINFQIEQENQELINQIIIDNVDDTCNDISGPDDLFYKPDETIRENKIPNKNLSVSNFQDQSSIWDDEQKNQNVSRFPDQSSNWSVNKKDEDSRCELTEFQEQKSHWSDQNETSKLNQTNGDQDHNQSSLCEPKLKNKTVLGYTEQDSESEWTINKSKQDLTLFDIQNSRWPVDETINRDKNEYVLRNEAKETSSVSNDKSLNETSDNKNQSVSRFLDDDLNWTMNKSKQDLTHFDEQNSKWNEDDNSLNQTSINKNQDVSKYSDQNSNWSTVEKSNENDESSYLSKTINNNNRSVWDLDPNQSTFNMKRLRSDFRKNELQKEAEENEQDVFYIDIINGIIIHFTSLDNFYIQIENADDKLLEMHRNDEKYYSGLKGLDKMPRIGEIYITNFQKEYQRVKVIECPNSSNISLNSSMNSKCKVLFIDYGNEEFINYTELFKISSPNLKNIPPLALNCKLNITKKFQKQLDENKIDYKKLIETIKEMTSKSKVTVKVISRLSPNLPILVDLFIENSNICDLLLLKIPKINLTQQEQHQQLITDAKLYLANIDRNVFDSYLINLNSTLTNENFCFVKILNESILKLIDNLINDYINRTDSNSSKFLCKLPTQIIEKFKLKSNFARFNYLNKQTNHVYLIDFDCELTLKQPSSDIIPIQSSLYEIPPAVETYKLNLNDEERLNQLNKIEIEHITEIFKLLINQITIYLPSSCISWSNQIKTVSFNSISTNSPLKKSIQLNNKAVKTVRLFDSKRENLDLNTILETAIHLMTKPYMVNVLNYDQDMNIFECVNEAANDSRINNEMGKIYRLAYSSLSSYENQVIKIGQLCLVDYSPSSKTTKDLAKSESILSLSDHQIVEDISINENDKNTNIITRCIIIDQIDDKCVTLNLDTGKKLTVSKRRIKLLESNKNINNYNNVLLAKLMPFFYVKIKTDQPLIDNINLKNLIHKSKYYGEKLQVVFIGSWKYGSNKDIIVDNKDLYKMGQFKLQNNDSLITNGTHSNEKNSISSIAIMNIKRKCSSSYDQSFSNNQTESSMSSHPFYYTLSHAKSINHFYLHTSETIKNLKSIEEQIKIDYDQQTKLTNKSYETNNIYGIYLKNKNKFYRVKLLTNPNLIKMTSLSNERCEIFYLDYGYTDKCKFGDLIHLSDFVQQYAPQAICCKLYGFQPNSNDEYADAESINNESVNDIHVIDDAYLGDALTIFNDLLSKKDNAKFMCTSYRKFNSSANKKIDNCVPLQADNTKPFEVVIHLFKDLNEFNTKNNNLNESQSFMNELNESIDDLLFRDLSYLIKKQLRLSNLKLMPSKKLKLNLAKSLNEKKECEVEFESIVDSNRFYLHLANWKLTYNIMVDDMKKDKFKSLVDKELIQGNLCVYIDQDNDIYKRAIIVSPTLSTENLIEVYFIDFGKNEHVKPKYLFYLNEKYYNTEPLCFECTLNLTQIDRVNYDLTNAKFKSLTIENKRLKYYKIKLIDEIKPLESYLRDFSLELSRFTISLYSVKDADQIGESPYNYEINIGDELKKYMLSLVEKMKKPKLNCYNEKALNLYQVYQCHLTNIESAKNFGIFLSSDLENRSKFLQSFQSYCKENRNQLKLLIEDKNYVKYIGKVCAFSSVQVGKWTRGLILSIESDMMTRIYLIDYAKTLSIAIDRIYKIENDEYLNHVSYVHRCQLIDDKQQRDLFSKYAESIISDEHFYSRGNNSASNLSIDNVQIEIECCDKSIQPIMANSEIKNYLYTVKVIDIKRTESLSVNSPLFSNRRHSFRETQIVLQHQSNSIKVNDTSLNNNTATTMVEAITHQKWDDETTENILCSTWKENGVHQMKLNISPNNLLTVNSQNEKAYHNETTFSAITESTRIQTEENYEDLLRSTNSDNTLCQGSLSSNTRRLIINSKKLSIDKREETSKWIEREFDDNVEEIRLSTNRPLLVNDLKIGMKLRVKILSGSFTHKFAEFIVQRVDLLKTYEKLQISMNEYYEKLINASKSIENNSNTNYAGTTTQFASMSTFGASDSLNMISGDSDLFQNRFEVNDYCAVQLNGKWVRCRILDIHSQLVLVECIDDFTSQRISINSIEKLFHKFVDMPKLAFKCKFADSDIMKLINSDVKKINEFLSLLNGNNIDLSVEILDIRKDDGEDDLYEVKLFKTNENKNFLDLI